MGMCTRVCASLYVLDCKFACRTGGRVCFCGSHGRYGHFAESHTSQRPSGVLSKDGTVVTPFAPSEAEPGAKSRPWSMRSTPHTPFPCHWICHEESKGYIGLPSFLNTHAVMWRKTQGLAKNCHRSKWMQNIQLVIAARAERANAPFSPLHQSAQGSGRNSGGNTWFM
jgi:hypothetical protein